MRMVCLCRKSTILSRQDDDDDDCRDGDLSMTIVMMKDEMTMMLIEEVQIMSEVQYLEQAQFLSWTLSDSDKDIYKDIYIYLMVFTGGHLESHS